MKIYKIENHKKIIENEDIKRIISYAMFNPTEGRIKSAVESVYGKQQGKFYVAEENETIIGIIGVRRVDNAYVEIMHIAVDEGHRMKDVARKMIRYVDDSERVDEIIAETDDDAVNFYKKLGFKVKKHEDKFTGAIRYSCVRRCL